MPTVYQKKRGGTWYVGYTDENGLYKYQATTAESKGEARALGLELEKRSERIRGGLEPRPVPMTFDQLADYWLEHYSKPRLRSHSANVQRLKLHLRPDLGPLQLSQVTPRSLEELFGKKLKVRSAQTVIHMRALVRKLFNDADRWGFFNGKNPAKQVPPPPLSRKPPVYASAADVPRLLAAAEEPFRTLVAVAIYTGLREGEILALRREAVDLTLGLIMVVRTSGSSTTKGKRFRAVPIVAELRPVLEAHLAATPGEYLFSAYRKLKGVRTIIGRELKYSLIKARMVLGYDHKCRRKGCEFVERRMDVVQSKCPRCGMLLWVTSVPMPLTFHQLRHTNISHLLMAGANPLAVQRMAGHADLKTTLDVYGHLAPGYMRVEAERLRFGLPTGPQKAVAAVGKGPPALPGHYPKQGIHKEKAGGPKGTARQHSTFPVVPDEIRTRVTGLKGAQQACPPTGLDTASEAIAGTEGVATGALVAPACPEMPAKHYPGTTRQTASRVALRAVAPLPPHLLTVREVAQQLRLSTATVYALCRRGELPHARVGNSLRFTRADVEAGMARQAAQAGPGRAGRRRAGASAARRRSRLGGAMRRP